MSKKPTTTRKASAKQEKYVATSLSGRVVSNSGASWLGQYNSYELCVEWLAGIF